VWVQPAAGDAGGALGAAVFTWHQLLGQPRRPHARDSQRGSLLGPRYSTTQIVEFLRAAGVKYHEYANDDDLCENVASLIEAGRVVGWVQDRMEFGPRALGARSILGDARSPAMQSVMNLKIKFRESFRPFAPSVLEERVHEYFDVRPREDSPYMLLVAPVRSEKRTTAPVNGTPVGLDRVKQVRSDVPAVTHVDYSARIQTVDADRHGRYYKLLQAFERRTGCPVIINTSFNVRGEPIVCTPGEALRCFLATHMDALVLERAVLLKEEQASMSPADVDKYLSQFQLD
jgi:carbamoyltransferase